MADSTGFFRPALRDVINRISGDLNTRLTGLDAHLRRSRAQVIARAVGGVAHTVYGYASSIAREILVSTASEAGLPKHGEIWSVPRRDAQASSGAWKFIGTPGTAIPTDTPFVQQNGLEWRTTADATVGVEAFVNVPCLAQEAGTIGNVLTGSKGTLTSPISGIMSAVTAAEDIESGVDVEDVEAWRSRILARIRNPPQGGAGTDYEQWTLQVAGVDRVWVHRNGMGPGSVVVRFTVPGEGEDVIPGVELVGGVQDHLEALAPVTADIYVVAPVAYVVDFTIELVPDDEDVRDAVRAELEALFQEVADPSGTVIHRSNIGEAISRADGEEYHTLTVPAGDVTPPVGQLPVVGEITWA